MKKVIIFIWLSIVLFFIINYKAIVWEYFSYKGTISYDNWSFSWALWYHKSLLNIKESPEILHNLWNDTFQIWRLNQNEQEKRLLYNKALEYYSWSLVISENLETRENYNYVLNKLDELEQDQEQENDNQNNQSDEKSSDDKNQEWSGKQKWETKEWWEKKEWWETKEWWAEWENWENNNQNSSSEEKKPLSESDMKELNNYIDKLKKQQENNAQYFNKEKQSWIEPNNLHFWNFINDPFFQDVFNRWWEKDW